MQFPIEFEGRKVTVHKLSVGIILRAEAEDGVIRTVQPPAILSVCAWCVPPSEQQPLKDAGFNLSHGICRHCDERMRAKEGI